MSKNIILLSDGTGNSAGAVWRTNVWRVYETLDLSRDDQMAFYDDGVGTSSFKPLALLGSAFGWGLKRNVIHLYAFLCRNYQLGDENRASDEIYCFGFSRGAFTIRLVTGLVTTVGLIDPAGKSDDELRREAKFIYRRYRRSRGLRGNLNYALVFALRWVRDLIVTAFCKLSRRTTPDEVRVYHRPRVRFVGLWDTVAAYGLPMYEMTRAVDLYFWPMSMRDRSLSDSVDRACHALALDDERTTFQPLLWNEENESRIFGGTGSEYISSVDQERISQVWFAGMHANVGGGYPDDGMAHVPLDWITTEAEKCGLKFKRKPIVEVQQGGLVVPTRFVARERDELRIAGDASGRIYNSRQGIAGYYRYGPRRLDDLNNDLFNEVIVRLPKIHESVFDRIRSGVGAYAPFVFPNRYAVVRWDDTIVHANANPFEHYTQSLSRFRDQEALWDWVWGRRVVYFLTLAATLYIAASPISEKITAAIYTERSPVIDALVTNTFGHVATALQTISLLGSAARSGWSSLPPKLTSVLEPVGHFVSQLAGKIVPPAIDVAKAMLPGFLNQWLDVYRQEPTWFAVWAAIIALLMYIGSWMEGRIDAGMRAIWNPIVAAPATPVTPSPESSSSLYLMRTSEIYRWLLTRMKYYAVPSVFALLFAVSAVAAAGVAWMELLRD